MFSFLPKRLFSAIEKVDRKKLYEIRMRENFPVILNFDNKSVYLSDMGVATSSKNAIVVGYDDIRQVINTVTEQSLYAYNDRIKAGYITTKKGVRIGLAGDCVFDGDKIVTIKNMRSLLIRVPHEILGCAEKIFSKIVNGGRVYNTLISSIPTKGKTTILKDLIRIMNERLKVSTLVIDERGEFSSVRGEFVDLISYSDKFYAFSVGVRALAPRIVVADELITENDWKCVKNVVECGVSVVATCHADNLNGLRRKDYFDKNVFDRYVFLDSENAPGVIKEIYDKDFNKL